MNDIKKEYYFCGDDKIQRGRYAQNLVDIIRRSNDLKRNNDNESYVIGIDAPWGTGKTQFVSMLNNYLRGKWYDPDNPPANSENAENDTGAEIPNDLTPLNTVYYDAWKNDFWDNAFEPFFDCLMECEYISKYTDGEIIENIFKTGKTLAKGIAKDMLKKFVGEDTAEVVKKVLKNGKGILDVKDAAGLVFPEYTTFRDAINTLRYALTKMVKDQKLVIIIDELDRCKPTFAVQTLEIVKHLFNVKGLVFIFALDVSQLSHAVKVVYGSDFEAVGYLERFFNYMTMLPPTHNNRVINMALENFDIDIEEEKDEVIDAFRTISRQFNLSLRDLQTVCAAYKLIWDRSLKGCQNIPNAMILYFYFLTMKYKQPVQFYHAVNDPGDELVKFLNEKNVPFINKRGTDDILYKHFIEVFSVKEISEIAFAIISIYDDADDAKATTGIIEKVKTDLLTIAGKDLVFTLKQQSNASLVLYKPDLNNFENIKNMTVMEYIYSQLEMCNFVGEDERIVHDEAVMV